jgi:hypothetical protein
VVELAAAELVVVELAVVWYSHHGFFLLDPMPSLLVLVELQLQVLIIIITAILQVMAGNLHLIILLLMEAVVVAPMQVALIILEQLPMVVPVVVILPIAVHLLELVPLIQFLLLGQVLLMVAIQEDMVEQVSIQVLEEQVLGVMVQMYRIIHLVLEVLVFKFQVLRGMERPTTGVEVEVALDIASLLQMEELVVEAVELLTLTILLDLVALDIIMAETADNLQALLTMAF